MVGAGKRSGGCHPSQESTSRDNGTNRERPKKAFVRQRESERRLIRNGVEQISGKGATILGEDRTMAFSGEGERTTTPTRPRTMH